MAKKKDDKANAKLHEQAIERFNEAETYYSDEYIRNEEDNNFCLGEQWSEAIKRSRTAEGRPCLTENRLLSFANKTINEIRQARPSVNVRPVDSDADVEVAEILRGMIKNIETVCDAETAYDTAAKNAIMAGYGHIRINTDYADYDSFDQEVLIERILNPFSVYYDPSHTRLDASDAEYVFIFDDMNREAFKEQYPDFDIDSFEKGKSTETWSDEKTVRVAEYFYKDYKDRELVKYSIHGVEQTGYREDVPEGATELDTRKVKECSIKWCKLSGKDVLEKGEFVGKYIPIVPVIGMEAWRDGKRQIYSLIHQAKDPQARFNFFMTASTEVIALQPKAPWVGAVGQFQSSDSWITANNVNHAYLEYDMVIDEETGTPAPPPMRQAPPQGSPAMTQEIINAAEGIQASLGIYDASLGQNTNDISGKAIISRQLQGDMATFHFVDNLSTAMKQVGRILVDVIPKVYSGKRVIRILGEDGTEGSVPLQQPVRKEGDNYIPVQAGEEAGMHFDLDAGKYDVVIEVGASYATKQQEAANAMIEIARVKPEIMEVAGDLFIKALNVPNGEIIAERIKATMPPELLGDDVEAQRLQALTEENANLQEVVGKLETALEVKEDDQRMTNELKSRELDIKAVEAEAKANKLNAEADIEIRAEAIKDLADAKETMQGELTDITGALEQILSHREEEVAVVPETTVI